MTRRILFVLQYYPPYVGGLEMIFQNLAERLVQRGYTVHVLTTHLPGTPHRESLRGVTVERLPVPQCGDRYVFTFTAIPAAIRLARGCDLIHTAPYNGALPAFLAGRCTRRPVLLTALEVLGRRWHLMEQNPCIAWGYRLFERLITRLPFERFAAISQATLQDCLRAGMPAAQGQVIYPGVDEVFCPGPRNGALRARLGLGQSDFVYLYFGRPGKTKGVEFLLRAAPQIQAAIPQAHLVLLLADKPRAWYARLLRLAADLPAGINIHLLPSVPRAALVDYLREADCIVIPSLTEGFGLTTAEACATAIPVVATRVGAIPEVISGRHVLVEAGSAAALAKGVLRVYRGEWDETPPKRFSWEAMVDAYEQLYQEMLG